MRALLPAALLTLAVATTAVPAAAQQPIKGQQAVAIVKSGQIRASSSQGFQGFLLLIEYRGASYTCTLTAAGQVQTCYPLHW